MPKYFGTDGIRGKPGEFPLDPSSLYWIGYILTQLLGSFFDDVRIIIGRDTRESSPFMEKPLCAGIKEGGGEPILTGVIPTSALSFLIREFGFSGGISISASHNPFQENGIKIFDWNGVKLEERIEEEIENEIIKKERINAKIFDSIEMDYSLKKAYLDFLKSHITISVPERFRVVIDCSNGSASSIAPSLLREFGLDVISIHSEPDEIGRASCRERV